MNNHKEETTDPDSKKMGLGEEAILPVKTLMDILVLTVIIILIETHLHQTLST